mmetsp:Transcript_45676/g.53471  ORF Transcript_45676/g.53471 Transcript_45676/m.53471 type:complete len:419 (-) Transcript_45676:174-1430(-)
MERWMKDRAKKNHGGAGMTGYMLQKEKQRIARLKNVKSSIPSAMKHNDWTRKKVNKRHCELKRERIIRENRSREEDIRCKEFVVAREGINSEATATGLRLRHFVDCTIDTHHISSPSSQSTSERSTPTLQDINEIEEKWSTIRYTEDKNNNIHGKEHRGSLLNVSDSSQSHAKKKWGKDKIDLSFESNDNAKWKEGYQDHCESTPRSNMHLGEYGNNTMGGNLQKGDDNEYYDTCPSSKSNDEEDFRFENDFSSMRLSNHGEENYSKDSFSDETISNSIDFKSDSAKVLFSDMNDNALSHSLSKRVSRGGSRADITGSRKVTHFVDDCDNIHGQDLNYLFIPKYCANSVQPKVGDPAESTREYDDKAQMLYTTPVKNSTCYDDESIDSKTKYEWRSETNGIAEEKGSEDEKIHCFEEY